MVNVRVICTLCGLDLATASLKNHVGRQSCLERKDTSLKVRRLQEARASKLAYDRRYTRAGRGVLEDLALRIVQPRPEMVPTTDSPSRSSPISIDPPAAPTSPEQEPTFPVGVPSRRPRRLPPVVIVIADDDGDDEDTVTSTAIVEVSTLTNCPICLHTVSDPVIPRSCSPAACSDCMSAFVAHSLRERCLPTCPQCRVVIRM
ncbi:Zinc ion binding protein [Phytophthora megakarya]|uniref:Zinc ion binding protein n=1 Tax=Phytophthora megakarya TaxID=4795 RepID=A0A225WP07_9STRA|nr:Zinc ion binding protein [Phytophthora megakarya]